MNPGTPGHQPTKPTTRTPPQPSPFFQIPLEIVDVETTGYVLRLCPFESLAFSGNGLTDDDLEGFIVVSCFAGVVAVVVASVDAVALPGLLLLVNATLPVLYCYGKIITVVDKMVLRKITF